MPCLALPHYWWRSGAPSDDRPDSTGPDADKPIQNVRINARGRSTRFSVSESGRRGGDLVAVAGLGQPRQPQRIVRVARDHVDVEVEHRLPGRPPARVEEVHAVG